MLRLARVRIFSYAIFAGIALALAGIAWLASSAIEGGHQLSQTEDITFDLLIGLVVLLSLGALVLKARERAELALRQQQRQLKAALENMTHGLCLFDAEGRTILFNRHYSEAMGLAPEYLQGVSLLDQFKRRKAIGMFADDPEEFFAAVKESMRQGKTMMREVVRGESILRIVDQPIEGGGWVATYEDITEQRRAERERDQNREFLDRLIDNVPSAIFVKSAVDRTYVLVNRAGESFWGKTRQEMVGRTAEQVFPPSEAKLIEGRDDELVQSGQPLFEEREILTSGDRLRSVFSRRLVIRDENGVPQYVLGVVDDVTERKAAEERIAHLAHYDPLTDLPNRVLFREQLEKELSLVRRGAQLAVLYLDIDHFKSINDTLGHPVGDELLKRVAHRLRGCLRDSDMISRLGGDEFAIIQTGIQDPKDAEGLAQRLREAVTQSGYDLNGHLTTADLSIGIALAPGDGSEIDDLVKHADLALYGAKAEGRANYRFYEPEMNARMKRRRELETDLRRAIANKEFELYYQPLVNLQTGSIAGCEALLRWLSPKHGMVPPLEFISVAEDTGLINPIGEWVLRQACKEAANWPSHVSVAVNISPVQFRNPGLALTVLASLTASGLPAQRLELEVTESVLMQNNETTLATLHQIRDLGVRISMDDFGTGYSSLSYLRRFPFDKIKIDRSFIGDLSKDDEALAVVRAILTLASSLKMATTAEGVETAEQKTLLSSLGCDQMQGYLFSVPRQASEIIEMFGTMKRPVKVA
jgi:diguanylate cyclase (GGDEF)-like protein/PAS domain S-box-containing protein